MTRDAHPWLGLVLGYSGSKMECLSRDTLYLLLMEVGEELGISDSSSLVVESLTYGQRGTDVLDGLHNAELAQGSETYL